VDAKCQPNIRIRHLRWVTKAVDSEATNWREEKFDISSCNKLGIRAACFLEERSAECPLI
jgi:hypothetical protein